jgi:hypothetical protein
LYNVDVQKTYNIKTTSFTIPLSGGQSHGHHISC